MEKNKSEIEAKEKKLHYENYSAEKLKNQMTDIRTVLDSTVSNFKNYGQAIQNITSNFRNYGEAIQNSLEKINENLKENLKNLQNEMQELSDKNKFNFYIAREFLENNPEKANEFIERKIWPPIFYLLDGLTIGDLMEKDNKAFNEINIDEIIKSEYLKKYYYKSMNTWIEDEPELHIKEFIKEIQLNFESDNIYVTTLNLFTLLEYKVDKARPLKEITQKYANEYKALKDNNYRRKYIKEGQKPAGITKAIEIILDENCFGYKDSKVLEDLYYTFFDRNGECYLYKDTEKNPSYITRHMLHGKQLNLINKEGMMSLVFLIDSIHKMLISEEKINRN